jgi:hypothetical protein
LACLGARAPRPASCEILVNSPSTDHKYPIYVNVPIAPLT